MKLKLIILITALFYSSNVFAAKEDLPCKNTHIESCKITCEAIRNNTIDYPDSSGGTTKQSAAADCAAAATTSKKQ
jgi:hypothetical protein